MKADKNTQANLLHLLYLVFLASLVFAWRAPSTISLAMILLFGLAVNSASLGAIFHDRLQNFLFAVTIAFLLYQLAGLFYTTNQDAGLADIRIKSALVAIPFALQLAYPGESTRSRIMTGYCLLLVAASGYCLIQAFSVFRESGNTAVFFYHELVKPIGQHAVYFSLLMLIAVIFILERPLDKKPLFNRWITVALLVWYTVILILLSSKFVIALLLAYVAYYIFNIFRKTKTGRGYLVVFSILLLCGIITLFVTKNPIRTRFADIFKGDISLITRDKFNPGIYFNGLQFRLLQWRFTGEILSGNNAWLTGVGAGDAEQVMNNKIISKNMYTGDGSADDRGYLAYNTHNQFLQTTLQNGIVGLVLLLLLCYFLARMAWREKHRLPKLVFILLLSWLFIESAFETQYGVTIFIFFTLFFCNRNAPAAVKPTF